MLSSSVLDKMRRGGRLFVRRPAGAVVACVVDADGATWTDLPLSVVVEALEAVGVFEMEPQGDARVFAANPAGPKAVWMLCDENDDFPLSPTDETMPAHFRSSTPLAGRAAVLPPLGDTLLMSDLARALGYVSGKLKANIQADLAAAGIVLHRVHPTNPRRGIFVVVDSLLVRTLEALGATVTYDMGGGAQPDPVDAEPSASADQADVSTPATDDVELGAEAGGTEAPPLPEGFLERIERLKERISTNPRRVVAVDRMVDVSCLLSLVGPATSYHLDVGAPSAQFSAGVELLLAHVDELLEQACTSLGHEGAVSGYMAEPEGGA